MGVASGLFLYSGEWSLQSEQGTQSAGQRHSLPSWCLSDEPSSFCLVFVCFCCCCSCYCSVFFLFSFLEFCFIPHCFLTPSPFPTLTPHPANCLSFAHFCALTFPFRFLYSLFLVSLVVAASELTECFCHAVCLKPWFYCCHTKLNLTWLLGCYLQFISLSAALVKRTLSRYFFFNNFSNHFLHCLQ